MGGDAAKGGGGFYQRSAGGSEIRAGGLVMPPCLRSLSVGLNKQRQRRRTSSRGTAKFTAALVVSESSWKSLTEAQRASRATFADPLPRLTLYTLFPTILAKQIPKLMRIPRRRVRPIFQLKLAELRGMRRAQDPQVQGASSW
jgi:hypothetical protein